MRAVLKSLIKPFTETVGLARWMLVIGLVITAIFVDLRHLRPVDRPVRLRAILARTGSGSPRRVLRARTTGSGPTGSSSTCCPE